jgi:hypothetical protein
MAADRPRLTMRHILIAALIAVSAKAGFADNLNRQVEVVNGTDFVMTNFYASNRDSTSWEEDIFGNSTLGPHSSVVINIDDGTGYCIYDFKAVFEDGDEVTDQINVCEVGTWTVH